MSGSPDIYGSKGLGDVVRDLRRPAVKPETGWIHVGTTLPELGGEFAPDFENDWDNVGGEAPPASFYLDADGEVRMRGAITGGLAGTVAFTLPDGYRPEFSMRFVGALSVGNDIATIQVDPDGKVWVIGQGWSPATGTVNPTILTPGSEGEILQIVDGVATWVALPGSTPGNVVTTETSFGQAADAGDNTTYSRSDHTHGTPPDPMPSHLAASDPHTQYQKESEKGAASGYASLGSDGLVPQSQLGTGIQDGNKFLRDDGTWVLPAELDGASPADTVVSETAFGQASAVGTSADYAREDHTHGTPTDPIPAHVAAADPHTQYQKESEKNAANGYLGLDGFSKAHPQYLGSGTRDGTKFLRDDGTWQYVDPGEGGGGGVAGDTVVSETAFGQAADAGDNVAYSRSDHTHGTPPDPIPAHVAASDPHPQYERESQKGIAGGYPSLDPTTGFVPAGQLGDDVGDPPGSKFLRDDGTWQGINTGANRWYDGSGAPDNSLGANDDYYVNTDNGDIYQKISGSWVLQGSMAGPAGPTGPTGPIAPRQLIATWMGTIPAAPGNSFVWRVPFPDGEDKTFNLERMFARVETLPVSVVQFRVDKSPGGGAFTPSTIESISLGSTEYEEEDSTISDTISSGDLLRLTFVSVGGTGQFHVEIQGSEAV